MLGYAVNGAADELALAMLAQVIDDLPIALHVAGARMQAAELVSLAKGQQFSVVCLADLPPSAPSKTRYLIKRLRAMPKALQAMCQRWMVTRSTPPRLGHVPTTPVASFPSKPPWTPF